MKIEKELNFHNQKTMKSTNYHITIPNTPKKSQLIQRRSTPSQKQINSPLQSKRITPNPNITKQRIRPNNTANRYFLNIDNYEMFNKNPIQGGFGIIYFVQHKKTGKRYASKTSYHKTSPEQRKFILRELNILLKIQHPTIVHFEGFTFNDILGNETITLFIDYMEQGTLYDLLEKERQGLLPHEFDNTKRQIILIGISRGMMILHKNNVIHRDLKPGNILINNDFKPLITDFGLSKIFTSSNANIQSMSECGTHPYMAPEIIEGNNFNIMADVYAFGFLMYEMVTGMKALDNMLNGEEFNARKFMNSVVDGKRPSFNDEKIKPGLKIMIEQCWSADPNDRPTFSEIYSKLSFNDGDFYVDSNDNICESIILCESDENDEYIEDDFSTKYSFDNVDINEVLDYIDEIDEKNASEKDNSEIQSLKKEIEHIKKVNSQIIKENEEIKIRI